MKKLFRSSYLDPVDGYRQHFISTDLAAHQAGAVLEGGARCVDHVPSTVDECCNGEYVIKLIKPRSYHECSKLLWGHSRLTKEIQGSFLLNQLGINTPEILSMGRGLIPKKGYRYIGYYLMKNLKREGCREVREVFQPENAGAEHRGVLFEAMLADIRKLRENNAVYIDLHPGQFLYNNLNQVVWLDAGVVKYPDKQKSVFEARFDRSLQRMIGDEFSSFTDVEIERIRQAGFNL